MTKSELIAALAAFPDDTVVIVDGYEYGYDDPEVYGARCGFKPNNDKWAGKYTDLDKDGQPVIVIGRKPK